MATGWALASTCLFVALVVLTMALRPDAPRDFVSGFLCQVVAYLLGLFLILRVHEPAAPIREVVAFGPARFPFYPLAVVFGVAAVVPVNDLHAAIENRFPSDQAGQEEIVRMLAEAGTPKRALLGFIIIALGPLLEEVFFRGALFGPLQKRSGPVVASIVTGVTFALAHFVWQSMLPLAILGVALAAFRARSGSLGPPTLVHATYNAAVFYAMLSRPASDSAAEAASVPVWLTASCTLVAAATLGLVWMLGRRAPAGGAGVGEKERDEK